MMRKTLASLVTVYWPALLLVGAHALEPVPHGPHQDDDALLIGSKGVVSLSSNGSSPDTLILDYGQNVEGIPTFEVLSMSGDTSRFEITYAESKSSFAYYMSDGPLPLAAAMDSYRVNRYNITKPSTINNRLVQGAFRYQKLNLSSPGTLTLRHIGVEQTVDITPLDKLPGSFQCSDEDLTRIWLTGARTVQLTEIPKNTVSNFWEITEDGALVNSAIPQGLNSETAAQLVSYRLDFDVKPLTGNFGFSVLMDTMNSGIHVSCDVLKSSISAYAGSTNLDTLLASAKLPIKPSLNTWHEVSATVNGTNLSVSIDNQNVITFNQTERLFGSFGLGTAFGHSAVFRNLKAQAANGNEIYSSTLKDESFLDDFLMGTNPADNIVDGSRRDRIAYAGDLDVALGASFASTYGRSFIDGTLELLGSYQATVGFFEPTAKIQQPPLPEPLASNMTGLIGYSFNFITALAQNYEMTGDAAFAANWAPKITKMLDWAHSQTDKGLFSIADPSFGGDWNYYDPTQTGIVSKFNSLYAYSLLQTVPLLKAAGIDVPKYEKRLDNLRISMNRNLWSEDIGAYVLSNDFRNGFAQDANALAILAGLPNGNISASRILSTLSSELFLPAGPLAFSKSTFEAGWARKISPYASAYHLRAAFQSNATETSKALLKSLWAPMANPANANYTNCFWETLEEDGTPGLGTVTSLCHGWGAGPTAELTRYVLGIQPVKPGFEQWRIAPQTLGLDWAHGRQRTVRGYISVEWRFKDGFLHMEVEGPNNDSEGIVYLPQPMIVPAAESVLRVNGKIVTGTSFTIKDGDKFALTQTKKE
ncbi:hypothetical protein MYU51_019557 [Penicillium brevicompactum]